MPPLEVSDEGSTHSDSVEHHFASDNYSGVHPSVLAAIAEANGGHAVSYGDDAISDQLRARVREQFGADARAYGVFNGTAANVVSLTALTPRWGSVITPSTSHELHDEAAAPARVSGIPLLPVDTRDGKLTPALLDAVDWQLDFVHHPQATTVSIAQTTELGTVYSPDEIGALADWAHGHDMLIHVDGARIFCAAAALGVPMSAFTSDVGVDIFSIGGTKNGALAAELVVCLNPDVAGLDRIRKYSMQLPSKARFFSAQMLALLTDDLGLALAQHSNAMAQRLRQAVTDAARAKTIAPVEFTQPTSANTILAVLDRQVAGRLRESYRFYDWDSTRDEVRWMTSWDTTEADIDGFVDALVAASTSADPVR